MGNPVRVVKSDPPETTARGTSRRSWTRYPGCAGGTAGDAEQHFCHRRPGGFTELLRKPAIDYPTAKPPALVTIDDRALTFDGTWPDMSTLQNFKPWNKRSVPVAAIGD